LNCDSVVRQVSSYIDGDVDATLRVEIEVHLQGCRHCLVFVDQVKQTVELFCDEAAVDLPDEIRTRLYAALQKKLGAEQTP
jgi:anti-sigma factor RsiW